MKHGAIPLSMKQNNIPSYPPSFMTNTVSSSIWFSVADDLMKYS